MDAVRARKLHEKVAIVASVLPLMSVEAAKARQARPTYGPVGDEVIQRLQKASDPAAEGLAICVEMIAKLKKIDGVRGIHILSGGCEAAAGKIVEKAALA
jgi:methylenetetrahydrofolate reductase (NADPH)